MKSYYGGPIGTHQRAFERYHPRPSTVSLSQDWGSQPYPKLQSLLSIYLRNGESYGLQIWSVHSESPSEQKPIKHLGVKETWAYPETAEFLDTLHYLRNG